MKAREIKINIPVTVRMSEDGNIEFVFDDDETKLDQPAEVEEIESEDEEKIMVPPLQQSIELQKAAIGKESEVIDQLTTSHDEDEAGEEEDFEDVVDAAKLLNMRTGSNPPWPQ